jgi:hypothetical protein
MGADARVGSGRPSRTALALSHDGGTLLFVGVQGNTTRLFRRALDRDQAEAIEGTEGAEAPFLSPDSRRVGFWSANALRWVPIEGGPVQTVVQKTNADERHPPPTAINFVFNWLEELKQRVPTR